MSIRGHYVVVCCRYTWHTIRSPKTCIIHRQLRAALKCPRTFRHAEWRRISHVGLLAYPCLRCLFYNVKTHKDTISFDLYVIILNLHIRINWSNKALEDQRPNINLKCTQYQFQPLSSLKPYSHPNSQSSLAPRSKLPVSNSNLNFLPLPPPPKCKPSTTL